jgi:hypothetical protein
MHEPGGNSTKAFRSPSMSGVIFIDESSSHEADIAEMHFNAEG